MTPTIELPQHLFERLQNHAIPFVDTPISVIERLADYYEATNGKKSGILPSPPSETGRSFDPLSPPDLLHTRVEGTFGDVHFRKWNELVRLAHVQSFEKAGSFEALRAQTHAQIRKGNHDGESGFHYLPEIGISVQGVDACHAWTYALRLAQFTKKPLRVRVTWRNNSKAAFPGETATMEWLP